MNLLNIPKSYIPSAEEMSMLDDILNYEVERMVPQGEWRHIRNVRELQRKLSLLDSVFRAAEEPDWTSSYPYVIQMNKCLACSDLLASPSEGRIGCQRCDYSVPEGRPPYPTDENGSFNISVEKM